MNERRYFYMSVDMDIDKGKPSRFVVESSQPPKDKSATFEGKVVAVAKNSPHSLGYQCSCWCNPVFDIVNGFSQSFVPIREEDVRLKFKDHILDV